MTDAPQKTRTDAWRSRAMLLALAAQALVDAIEEADIGVVSADPRIEAALAKLQQELKL